jgi:FKBP-type peptidyl-prolyl cis-trans isomerase
MKFVLGEGNSALLIKRSLDSSFFYSICVDSVTEGFEVAIKSMKKKEEARFLIKPEYFLGKAGCPPRIPGGETGEYWL